VFTLSDNFSRLFPGPVRTLYTRHECHLVSEDHDTVVCFAAEGTTDTLGRVTHCVEGQEVVLADVELVAKVLKSSLQHHCHTGSHNCRWGGGKG